MIREHGPNHGPVEPALITIPAVTVPTALVRSGAALSGLLLVLFVLVHLIGLLPAVLAPEQLSLIHI